MCAFQHELRVFTVQTATDPGLLTGVQAGTSKTKVVPSLTTITGNPVVVLVKVVACSAYVIIL